MMKSVWHPANEKLKKGDKMQSTYEEDTEAVKSKGEKRKKKRNKKNREDELKALNEQENIEVVGSKDEKRNNNKKIRKDDVKAVNDEENIELEENQDEEMKMKKKENKKEKKKYGCKDDREVVESREEKRKRKKNKKEDNLKALNEEKDIEVEETEEEMNMNKKEKKKKKRKMKDDLKASNEKERGGTDVGNVEGQSVENKKKKKKKKKDHAKSCSGDGLVQSTGNNHSKNMKTGESILKFKRTACNEEHIERATPKSQSKRVKFSDQVEVFPIPTRGSDNIQKKINEENMVRGIRYTKEEDEILKQAALNYVKAHSLGPDGINMILNCRKHKQVRGCWKEIAEALPHRPRDSIYFRTHNILSRAEKKNWSKEDIDFIKEMHAKHGADWNSVAKELGRFRVHVKDAYRRTRFDNQKKGHWSQDEYQKLFDLVNADLEVKAYQEKKSKHGMLRDNISWEAISDNHGTRAHNFCCDKWYHNLSSPMVSAGTWGDADDYRLLIELYNLDASCEEEVEWDSLIEDRPGDVCRKRWHQMVLHIGEHGIKSFVEQVEVLSKRYCPHMLEIREKLDSRPVVD